ncbi:hypothetical protein BSZ19_47010 [Bradyrhizobium japonicum]|uniref:Uncharacterized protein n=1 Tax=Bradyrhizobium japonicum TaxID=375 RepID=A0A1Y2J7P3_BRAJP|nr:hypothetical protein [Bradyrhizobium japonicum]OSJ22142.1 hypothetical protein BSZ19_47010 [Bradyrhizobium japonicum]
MSSAIRFPQPDVGRAERDRLDAGAYREMEGDLRDLVNMGRIAANLAHDADGEPTVCEKRNLALFGVYHLHEMLLRFEMKYDDGDWRIGGGGPGT